jgi:hypothetical protein
MGVQPFALQINLFSVIIRNIFFVSLKFFRLKLIFIVEKTTNFLKLYELISNKIIIHHISNGFV